MIDCGNTPQGASDRFMKLIGEFTNLSILLINDFWLASTPSDISNIGKVSTFCNTAPVSTKSFICVATVCQGHRVVGPVDSL